jgi:hypothetical protein
MKVKLIHNQGKFLTKSKKNLAKNILLKCCLSALYKTKI